MTTHPARTPARSRVRPARRPVPAWAAACAAPLLALGLILCLVCAASTWVPGVITGALLFVIGVKLTGRKTSKYIDLGPVKWE